MCPLDTGVEGRHEHALAGDARGPHFRGANGRDARLGGPVGPALVRPGRHRLDEIDLVVEVDALDVRALREQFDLARHGIDPDDVADPVRVIALDPTLGPQRVQMGRETALRVRSLFLQSADDDLVPRFSVCPLDVELVRRCGKVDLVCEIDQGRNHLAGGSLPKHLGEPGVDDPGVDLARQDHKRPPEGRRSLHLISPVVILGLADGRLR
ncbi:MAG: hypothetical protein ACYTAQ_16755 [Planctomycetota bacterium]